MKWIRDNDIILRVTALLLAVVLWVYVMSIEPVDGVLAYPNIPVRLEGVSELKDNDLVILSGSNSTISATGTGKRSLLQEIYKDYLNVFSATASVSHITEPGEYDLSYKLEKDSVADEITLTKTPSQITVVVDRMNTISVPVEVELAGSPGDNITIAGVTSSPDAVIVRGPESILRQIDAARVVYDITGLNASLQTNVTYTLLDQNGEEVTNTHLSPDTPSTTLSISLRQQGEVPLTVELKDSPYLKSYMVEAPIDPPAIRLTGDPETLREINSIELGAIDLSEVLEEGTTEFARVIQLPDGLSLAEGQREYVQIRISLDGCGWETIQLDQTNLPEDVLLTYPEQQFSIEIFGTDTDLDRLRDSDIQLEPIYELEELTVGRNRLPCRITLENENLYVKQELEVLVEVTQEALDNALNPQPTDPDDPNAPSEPTEPGEPLDPTEAP